MISPAPALTGQQSLERLCAGHPLAVARLKELMLNEARYRFLREQTGEQSLFIAALTTSRFISRLTFGVADAEIDQAIAEGGQ